MGGSDVTALTVLPTVVIHRKEKIMDSTIIVAFISGLFTLVGTLGGILASSKLTAYRIEQL